MVTHKVPALQMCDRILVVDNGRIVEEGKYDELMQRRGVFATLASGGEWFGDSFYHIDVDSLKSSSAQEPLAGSPTTTTTALTALVQPSPPRLPQSQLPLLHLPWIRPPLGSQILERNLNSRSYCHRPLETCWILCQHHNPSVYSQIISVVDNLSEEDGASGKTSSTAKIVSNLKRSYFPPFSRVVSISAGLISRAAILALSSSCIGGADEG
ncbi:hypothetical protein BT96DRAFT_1003907 [Gymnopus androsaceus JB14]|uniref:P-loop containing nucleoside triphosphate hydrolase protein n=1 Tax=Gymnopus androsaceus JB14 TaxID=1447944 RepID=A0A6A4GSG8_9AGAR|nr:hypothetical protein BT96DRAFT_1003907 [Gymnopus androsaceus JB14]